MRNKVIYSIYCAIILAFMVTLMSHTSHAAEFKPALQIIAKITGVATDPIGLVRSSRNALLVVDRLDRLENKVNQNLKDRINQLSNEAIRVINAADAAFGKRLQQISDELDKVLSDLYKLEAQIFADLECVGPQLGDTLDRYLIRLIETIKNSDIKIESWLLDIELKAKKPEYVQPNKRFGLYEQAALNYIANLDQIATVDLLREEYSNLARLARLTTCHYKKEEAERTALFIKHRQYNEAANLWLWIKGV